MKALGSTHSLDTWFGRNPAWQRMLEFGSETSPEHVIAKRENTYSLVYRIVNLQDAPRSFRVEFRPISRWGDLVHLPPEEDPAVFADIDRRSPHRHFDQSLCLFHVEDPPYRRWLPSNGLIALIALVDRHLFLEERYVITGAWEGEEAPHGK